MSLTAKQRRFCHEYLIDLNASAAAVRAGYSLRTAKSIGSENLAKPDIQNCITELVDARAEVTDVAAADVVNRLWTIANFDIRKCFDELGELMPVGSLDDATATAITAYDQTDGERGSTRKVKAVDKIRALELLGRHLGMFTDKVEHSCGNGSNVVIVLPDNGRSITPEVAHAG